MLQKFITFLFHGGLAFMLPITLCGMLVIYFFFLTIWRMKVIKKFDTHFTNQIVLFGSLPLFIGLLGQAIGLFQALSIIENLKEIEMSQTLILEGFKITIIAPIYGCSVCTVSLILWAILKEISIRKTKSQNR